MQGNPKTVGELRQLIAHLPDHAPVFEKLRDGDFCGLPEDAIYCAMATEENGKNTEPEAMSLIIWLDQ